MNKFYVRITFITILFILQICLSINGQTSPAKHLVESKSGSCSDNHLFIDMLISEAKQTNERIFIISRLNKKVWVMPSKKVKYNT